MTFWLSWELVDVGDEVVTTLAPKQGFLSMCSGVPCKLVGFFPLPNICISENQIECALPRALLRTSNEVEKCTLMTERYLVLNRVNCF